MRKRSPRPGLPSNLASIELRKVQDLTDRLEPEVGSMGQVCFSPDGKTLATCGGGPNDSVKLWDFPAMNDPIVLADRPETAAVVTFSPEGRFLAAGGMDGGIRLSEVAPAEGR